MRGCGEREGAVGGVEWHQLGMAAEPGYFGTTRQPDAAAPGQSLASTSSGGSESTYARVAVCRPVRHGGYAELDSGYT